MGRERFHEEEWRLHVEGTLGKAVKKEGTIY
jgi:hypothetical protein